MEVIAKLIDFALDSPLREDCMLKKLKQERILK